MSHGQQRIVCRRCGENIDRNLDSCPHCGADIRGLMMPAGMVLVGLVILIPSLLDFAELWWLGMVGLLLALGGGYFIYDKRKRIREAESTAAAA